MDGPEIEPGSAANPNDTLILVPVTDIVLLPGTVMPMAIGRPAVAAGFRKPPAQSSTWSSPSSGNRCPTPPASTICIRSAPKLVCCATSPAATVPTMRSCRGGSGSSRIRTFCHLASCRNRAPDRRTDNHSPEIDARFHQLRERSLEVLRLIEHAPAELADTIGSIDRPGALADFVTDCWT